VTLIAGLQVTLPDPVTVIVSPLDAELTQEATEALSSVLVHVGLDPVQAASITSANENTMIEMNINIRMVISKLANDPTQLFDECAAPQLRICPQSFTKD
jgi:polysaccharide deacetylase 2 family uncharacterized protein YibQ